VLVKEVLTVNEYRISQDAARQIAVGIYRNAVEFVAAAKRDNLKDYESFKIEYLAKHSTQASAPVKRRYTRSR
jgi:hypothetical protein